MKPDLFADDIVSKLREEFGDERSEKYQISNLY
jgi:hypothetical protein